MTGCDAGFIVGFAFGAAVAAGALILLAIAVCFALRARPPRIEITKHEPES